MVAFGFSPPHVLARDPPGRRRMPIELARGRLPINVFRRADGARGLANRRATQRLRFGGRESGGGGNRIAGRRDSLLRLIERAWARFVVLRDRSADDRSIGGVHTNISVLRGGCADPKSQKTQRHQYGMDAMHDQLPAKSDTLA